MSESKKGYIKIVKKLGGIIKLLFYIHNYYSFDQKKSLANCEAFCYKTKN